MKITNISKILKISKITKIFLITITLISLKSFNSQEQINQGEEDPYPFPPGADPMTDGFSGAPISEKENYKDNNWDAEWSYDEKPYFSEEILAKYAEYTQLEDLDKKQTCNYEMHCKNYDEERTKSAIKNHLKNSDKNFCVPDSKSLTAILENGWKNLSEYLIKEVYLPKNIDPSIVVHGYINSSHSKLKTISQVLKDFRNSKNLKIKFIFENYENSIKANMVFPDASYTPEYLSIFCFKDSLKINGIIKSRNRVFKIEENKRLYDEIEGSCKHVFNSFTNSVEINFDKLKKLKKWERLFK